MHAPQIPMGLDKYPLTVSKLKLGTIQWGLQVTYPYAPNKFGNQG